MPKQSRPDGQQATPKNSATVDFAKLQSHLAQQTVSQTEFFECVGLGRGTQQKLIRGEPLRFSTIRRIAAEMGLEPADIRKDRPQRTAMKAGQRLIVDEWESVLPISDWQKTSNGLQYRIYRMRHRFTPDLQGRGKCYDLDGLNDRARNGLAEYLLRHADICQRLGAHPNLPVNLRCCPAENSRWWWIVDRWTTESSLEDVSHPLKLSSLKSVMRQIADGLSKLHSNRIIRRELAPKNVLLTADTGEVVLTDFELGKLGDGRPTVSPRQWPSDPFRAPEVGKGGQIDESADVFSWGRIFVKAATGQLPANGQEGPVLMQSSLPREIQKLVLSCVDAVPRSRQFDISTILSILDRWTVNR